MNQIIKKLRILAVIFAIPLMSSAAPNAKGDPTPRLQPLVNVYLTYLRLAPGHIYFQINGRFVKSSNEIWTTVEDPTIKNAILIAFYQHKRIDITDYSVLPDAKANLILAKEISLHAY